jgi:hypothetical protein
MKLCQEIRDAAKGQNDTLSTADIRAAMAKKAEEFKSHGSEIDLAKGRCEIGQYHTFERFFCLVERLGLDCVEALGTGSLATPS